MNRVPMLSGSRLTVVNTPDDAVILRPRPPGEAIGDIAGGSQSLAEIDVRRFCRAESLRPPDRQVLRRLGAPGRAA